MYSSLLMFNLSQKNLRCIKKQLLKLRKNSHIDLIDLIEPSLTLFYITRNRNLQLKSTSTSSTTFSISFLEKVTAKLYVKQKTELFIVYHLFFQLTMSVTIFSVILSGKRNTTTLLNNCNLFIAQKKNKNIKCSMAKTPVFLVC